MIENITERVIGGADNPALLNQLLERLSHRIVSGPMVFGASFRANGKAHSFRRGGLDIERRYASWSMKLCNSS